MTRGCGCVRTDLRELRLPRRPFRVVASPPYQLSTELVRLLMGTDRMLSADLVLERGAVRRMVERPPRARHARRYTMEPGLSVPRQAFRPVSARGLQGAQDPAVVLGLEEPLQRDLGRGGEVERVDEARVDEHDLASLIALDVVIHEVHAHHEQPELVVAVGVLVMDRELAEQLQAVF